MKGKLEASVKSRYVSVGDVIPAVAEGVEIGPTMPCDVMLGGGGLV